GDQKESPADILEAVGDIERQTNEALRESTKPVNAAASGNRPRWYRLFDEELIDELTRLGPGAVQGRLLLVGPAGAGKTHALCDAALAHLESGGPALLYLGHKLQPVNILEQLARQSGRSFSSTDEFLGALDAAAEVSGSRAVVVIDAINEARG